MDSAKKTKTNEAKDEKLMTLDEAVKFLGTSKPTMYRLLDGGKIKGRKVGNQWRFLPSELRGYLERSPLTISLSNVSQNVIEQELTFFSNELRKLGKLTPSWDELSSGQVQEKIEVLFNCLVAIAVSCGSSDIHLESSSEAQEMFSILRFRIDGGLKEMRRLPVSLTDGILKCLKNMMSMDLEIKRPQDGRILVKVEDRDVDLRVSIVPTIFGESLVLRILDKKEFPIGFEKLGIDSKDLEQIRSWGRKPNGLILFTGPTGCGKTTLMYSMLKEITRPEIKSITIEDPVELAIPWSTQIKINPSLGISFQSAIRSIFRQDPDVIMIGEIRDKESLILALQGALTGHLVFTTFHTNDTFKALMRFSEMGVEPFLTASALIGIISQRLVTKVCPKCKQRVTLSEKTLDKLQKLTTLSGINLSTESKFFKGKGCANCFNSGYRGRTGVFEILENSPKVRDAFIQGASEDTIRSLAMGHGMTTFASDGLRKLSEGITTLEEVFRLVSIE